MHVLKSDPFTVCNKLARCHPNFISLADTCQNNFVMKLLHHSADQTWLYVLQLYFVMQATIDSVAIMKCMLAKLDSIISPKEKFAAQGKCSKCCPSTLTQVCSRPCHSLMALSTTRCSRPDHVAIRRCIVCYRAAFKLVLDYQKCFSF